MMTRYRPGDGMSPTSDIVACSDIQAWCLAAWNAVRQVRDHAGAMPQRLTLDLPGTVVTVEHGGQWQAQAPVPDAARDILDCLLPLVAQEGPLTIAQLGQSLDGRIATQSGHSHYINGIDSRTHLHRLRGLVDAVLVGAGTVCEDDPQLNVRHVPGDNPVRVVLDPRGRVPAERHVFQVPDAPTLHLVGADAVPQGPVGDHVIRAVVESQDGRVSPRAVIDYLAGLGHTRLLIEGGGTTVSRFLEARALHRLHLLIAPLLIGSGRAGLSMPPIVTLDEALRPVTRWFRCGDDTIADLDFTAARRA